MKQICRFVVIQGAEDAAAGGATAGDAAAPCPKLPNYTHSIHWACQVESITHAWTPEIYESVTIPITVVRIMKKSQVPGPQDPPLDLHFDFEVKTTLRCMGVGVSGPLFINPSKPADMRIKDDTGVPLMSDHYSFCLRCNVGADKLPKEKTLDIGEAAKRFLREVRLVT